MSARCCPGDPPDPRCTRSQPIRPYRQVTSVPGSPEVVRWFYATEYAETEHGEIAGVPLQMHAMPAVDQLVYETSHGNASKPIIVDLPETDHH